MGFEKLFDDYKRRMEKQRVGDEQVVLGQLHKRFIEKFLDQLDEEHRNEIESLVRSTFQYDNFKRFRYQMILALALSHDNGAVAAAKGKRVDVRKLIKEAGDELIEETIARLSKRQRKKSS
jgi:hypothetical protein